MSAADYAACSDQEVISAVLGALRVDAALQAVLGAPARLFDDDPPGPSYPYAVLERHESRAANGVNIRGLEHSLQFATYARYGGVRESKTILGALRAASETMSLDLSHQRLVLVVPTYCDVMRTRNQTLFRGVLRLRIHTQELDA